MTKARPTTTPNVFRTSTWLRVAVMATLPLFGAAAWLGWHGDGGWVALVATALVPFALAGVLDAWLARVELREDAIVIVHNLRRRAIPRDDVQSVSWAKGVPATLALRQGGHVELPPVGPSTPVLAAAVRAWLRTRGP